MKKVNFSKIFVSMAVVVMSLLVTAPAFAAGGRDYDSNAIIYGGTYSISELNSKLNNGTGKPYQSSKQLKALFAAYGIKQSDFGQLKSGYVNKKNQVVVNGKVVATNVTTMGRHDIAGSTHNTKFGYPLYLRHPSVSFLSDNLPAYVSINYDGSYAYAILKPCGNIVVGPGVKVKPAPKPPVVVPPVVPPVLTPPVLPPMVTSPTPTTVVTAAVITAPTPVVALPTSGPVTAAAGAVGLTGTTGALYAWLKSKKALAGALKKF